jgi:hypothetical protein
MILSTAETASLRTIFPQKPLQLLRVQALRDVSKIYDADRTGGQIPAFTEDLNAPVLIQGQPSTGRGHDHEELFALWSQPKPLLQPLKPSSDRPHDFSVVS